MPVPTGTQLTYPTVGNREDLADIIYDISPTETPFMNAVEQTAATATKHEWLRDALAAAANNAVLEGDDPDADALVAAVREENYTQISRKVARVSGTQRAVNKAGTADELTYQTVKKGLELKRDMETALLANKGYNVGAAGAARELRGLPSWYASTTVNAGSGGTDGTDTTARGAGTARALDETLLKDVLQKLWVQGSNANVIMANGFNRQGISAFAGNSTAFRNVGEKKIDASVSVYAGDFGEYMVVANRFQVASDVHVIDPAMAAVAFVPGRKFEQTALAKTGDSDRVMILSEYTLENRNLLAHGLIADLTTS